MLNRPNWQRRLVTVPILAVAVVVVTALFPIALVLSLIFDLFGGRARRLPTVRTTFFVVSIVVLDAACVIALFFTWFTTFGPTDALSDRLHRAIQCWWARSLLRTARVFGGIDVRAPCGTAEVFAEPSILLARHTTYPDALLPLLLLNDQAGKTATFVLMRELLWSPAIDICGHRFENHFVRRGSGDPARETQAIEHLTREFGPPEHSMVIFPEGGLADAVKRARILEKMSATDPARAQRLSALQHLMPIRPPGTLALLNGAPDTDVVTLTHAGLEGAATFADLWRSIPLSRPVAIELRRHDRRGIPATDADRVEWLDERWCEMDAWVESQLQ